MNRQLAARCRLLVGLAGVVLNCCAALAAEAPTQAAIEAAVVPLVSYDDEPAQATLVERMKHYGVPGVSVAVVAEGKLAWAAGYGTTDVAQGSPVTPETLFQAASISKPVAMLGTLQLVAAGRLELDADVQKYLQRWQIPANTFTTQQPVTLRLLMSHRGGTTVHGFRGYQVDEPLPTLVQILAGTKPANNDPVLVVRTPGESFVYSGGGTTIVQTVVKDVTGEPLAALLEREVLRPLEMHASSYAQPLPTDRQDQAASGHTNDGKVLAGRWHVYPEQAAAGLWTTSSDLCRYVMGVQRALAGEPGAVLPRELAEQMVTPVGEGPFGLGPFLTLSDGRVVRFSHGGSNAGFRCEVAGTIEGGCGAAVMTNSDNGGELASEILRTIARAYGWPGAALESRRAIRVDDPTLQSYVGKYAAGPLPVGELAVRDGRVFIQASGGALELFFVSPTTFFSTAAELEGEIHVAEDGTVTILAELGGNPLKLRKLTPQPQPAAAGK
ncbi:MAG: beta-lactamase family protein [Pirellulales bacterium]|nr:beta-lactamase family protein [Pirellulales bacterium]